MSQTPPKSPAHILECDGVVEIWQNWGENSPARQAICNKHSGNVKIGDFVAKAQNVKVSIMSPPVHSSEGWFKVEQIVYTDTESEIEKQKQIVTHLHWEGFPLQVSPPSLSPQKRPCSLLPEQKDPKQKEIPQLTVW